MVLQFSLHPSSFTSDLPTVSVGWDNTRVAAGDGGEWKDSVDVGTGLWNALPFRHEMVVAAPANWCEMLVCAARIPLTRSIVARRGAQPKPGVGIMSSVVKGGPDSPGAVARYCARRRARWIALGSFCPIWMALGLRP